MGSEFSPMEPFHPSHEGVRLLPAADFARAPDTPTFGAWSKLSCQSAFLLLLRSSPQVARAAQRRRADSSSRHFSQSALICSIQPRACRTSLPASRYGFHRSVATVAVP